jgi:3-oxoacyl-[acyl-carrier protein] reductase
MNLGLTGKRALILGASRGLGLEIARGLAAEGARLALVGRDLERLTMAAAQLPGAATIGADLSSPQTPGRVVLEAIRFLGGIDILVNNSGGPAPAGALGADTDTWRREFESMVCSIIKITELAIEGMKARQWGRILTIASSGVTQPIEKLAVSNTLRAAVVAWSKTLATEIAKDGITANILVPGRIDTERVRSLDSSAATRQGKTVEEVARASWATIPAGRYGHPDEFAAPAIFLASEQASYITGSVIRVDGGMIRSIF